MLTAILSFLMSAGFRLVLGDVIGYLKQKQEANQEMARIEAQRGLEAQLHAQRMEVARLEADKGMQMIHVQAEATADQQAGDAFKAAVDAAGKTWGNWFIDAWNGAIRPGLATWAVVMLSLEAFGAFKMGESTAAVCGAALGLYLGQRDLFKRGVR
jgi:hypothetical protein